MPRLRVIQQQNRSVRSRRGLQPRRHFPRMQRGHPRIPIARDQQHCRIRHAPPSRGDTANTHTSTETAPHFPRCHIPTPNTPPPEISGSAACPATDTGTPPPGTTRPLCQHRSHQQSSVAPAFNRQFLRLAPFLRNQIFRRRNKIIEHILLFLQHPRAVPLFSELAAPAQIRYRQNPSVFRPHDCRLFEIRRDVYVESSIPRQQHRRIRAPLTPFFENRNIGIFVPSLDLYETCSTWKSAGFNGTLLFAHTDDSFVFTSYVKIVGA